MRKNISDAHAAIAALDLTAHIAAAVKARKLRKKDSGRAEKEYRQFLLIAWNNFAAKSREPVLPTPQADQIWHQHILHTEDYGKFCRRTFGGMLHHRPGTPKEAGARSAASLNTRKMLGAIPVQFSFCGDYAWEIFGDSGEGSGPGSDWGKVRCAGIGAYD